MTAGFEMLGIKIIRNAKFGIIYVPKNIKS